MDEIQQRELLVKLLEGTRAKKYQWKVINENIFSAPFGSANLIVLDRVAESAGLRARMYQIQIHSSLGRAVAVLDVVDFVKAGMPKAFEMMQELVGLIRNQTQKIDETLGDIFKNL